MTREEINKLPWSPGEKFALVETGTDNMPYASDEKQWCEDTLAKLNHPLHPMAGKLELVSRYE